MDLTILKIKSTLKITNQADLIMLTKNLIEFHEVKKKGGKNFCLKQQIILHFLNYTAKYYISSTSKVPTINFVS